MPNESHDDLEQPSPGEIDRMESDWRAQQSETESTRTQELLDSTERMLDMFKESREHQEATDQKEDTVFEVPPAAQARLDTARADYDSAWEREDSSSTPQTSELIREKLGREGLRAEPPTAEEVEAASLQEEADKRAEATAKNPNKKHARNLHGKPTRYVSPRDKGAPEHIARQIRGGDL